MFSSLSYAHISQINKEYQIYFLFVVFLLSLQLICNTIEPVIFHFGLLQLPASALFYVLSFAVADVMTENFGFKLAVRATILNVFLQLVYCGVATLVFLIPRKFQADENLHAVFHYLSLELLSSIIALLVSMITNDYLINRLKLWFLGKGFWWRTIVSTVLGELVMLNIDYNITFFGHKSMLAVQALILGAMSYKIIAAIVLALPITLLSNHIGKYIFFLKPNMNHKTSLMTDLKDAFFFR